MAPPVTAACTISRPALPVIITTRENFQKLQVFAKEYVPQVSDRLLHYTGERPLFDLHAVEEEIQKALARRVDLKSGGYLIFDQTEACHCDSQLQTASM